MKTGHIVFILLYLICAEAPGAYGQSPDPLTFNKIFRFRTLVDDGLFQDQADLASQTARASSAVLALIEALADIHDSKQGREILNVALRPIAPAMQYRYTKAHDSMEWNISSLNAVGINSRVANLYGVLITKKMLNSDFADQPTLALQTRQEKPFHVARLSSKPSKEELRPTVLERAVATLNLLNGQNDEVLKAIQSSPHFTTKARDLAWDVKSTESLMLTCISHLLVNLSANETDWSTPYDAADFERLNLHSWNREEKGGSTYFEKGVPEMALEVPAIKNKSGGDNPILESMPLNWTVKIAFEKAGQSFYLDSVSVFKCLND